MECSKWSSDGKDKYKTSPIRIYKSEIRRRMRFGRWMAFVRRRSKTIFLWSLALAVVFLLAWNLVEVESSPEPEKSPVRRVPRLESLRGNFPEVHQDDEVSILRSNETYSSTVNLTLEEHIGEFDTFDMYKVTQGGGKMDKAALGSTSRKSSKEKLKVFILPFTHVDPGWLRTFDSYSEDTNKILTNMHTFMKKNPEMRFMWAEFVFFERWWKNQTSDVKEDVKQFVKEGRVELASGSWVMTDEANAYFPVSVDNIIEGHQFILEEFGIRPTTIWSNDPFGYSNSVPYLFRQAGIKHNVINRIHHGLKQELQSKVGIPFNWKQYFDPTDSNDILTQVLPYTHYDILNSCGPSPSVCCEFDFKRMTHWSCPGPKPVPITKDNVVDKASKLVSQLQSMANMYEAPVILMMHGDDFRFDMIEEWHQHHDNFLPLFKEINKGDEAEIRFGTFNDYFTALDKWYQDNGKHAPSLTGDFFPYRCALGDLWTGYFTTRPFYKRQARQLHSLIRAADIVSSLAHPTLKAEKSKTVAKFLENARRTLLLFQHHDAITGTSKKHVMENYSQLLYRAHREAENAFHAAWADGKGEKLVITHSVHKMDETMSKSVIKVTASKVFVTVYNPLPYNIMDTVAVLVDSEKVVLQQDDHDVEAQLEPYILHGKFAQNAYSLRFAVQLEPLSSSVFVLSSGSSKTTHIAKISTKATTVPNYKEVLSSIFKIEETSTFSLDNERISTTHEPRTGALQQISSKELGKKNVQMQFLTYSSHGGAYIMRNNGEPKVYDDASSLLLVSGPVQQSLHIFSNIIYTRMSVKNIDGALGQTVEFHFRVNIKSLSNTEFVMRVTTDLKKPAVYTDSVGMQLLRRESHKNIKTAGNYYPMPSAAVMEDGETRLTIATNLEHGIMPLSNGVEIMLDRIQNQDDGKGLGGEPDAIPDDMKPVDMQFSFLLEQIKESSPSHYTAHTAAGHLIAQNVIYPPIIGQSNAHPSSSEDVIPPLPCDYQLLTIRAISGDRKIMTIVRNGMLDTNNNIADRSCGIDAEKSIKAMLQLSGAKSVEISNLSGNSVLSKTTVEDLKVNLSPFDFLTLIISY